MGRYMVNHLKNIIGLPNILINNAGYVNDNIFIKMTNIQWEEVLNINLSGVYYLSKYIIKNMIKLKWGRIVNISSIIGYTGNIGQTNYSTAKSGLIGFSKSLARELSKKNITVNIICPGYIETDMTKKYINVSY